MNKITSRFIFAILSQIRTIMTETSGREISPREFVNILVRLYFKEDHNLSELIYNDIITYIVVPAIELMSEELKENNNNESGNEINMNDFIKIVKF